MDCAPLSAWLLMIYSYTSHISSFLVYWYNSECSSVTPVSTHDHIVTLDSIDIPFKCLKLLLKLFYHFARPTSPLLHYWPCKFTDAISSSTTLLNYASIWAAVDGLLELYLLIWVTVCSSCTASVLPSKFKYYYLFCLDELQFFLHNIVSLLTLYYSISMSMFNSFLSFCFT